MIIETVRRYTAEHFGMSTAELDVRNPLKPRRRAKCIAVYLAWKLTGASFPDIAKAFGASNHTSMLYHRDRAMALLEVNRVFRADLEAIERRCHADEDAVVAMLTLELGAERVEAELTREQYGRVRALIASFTVQAVSA